MHEVLRLLRMAEEDSSVNGANIFLPFGGGDVVSVVGAYVIGKGGVRRDLIDYVSALRVVWPELFKANERAAMLIACDVYLECAQLEGFAIEPENLVRGFEMHVEAKHAWG